MSQQLINIVLIDDDEVDCELVARLLRKTDLLYHLHVFHEGEKAIDFLASSFAVTEQKVCYLIMLDINLPSMNGFQIIDKLKQLNAPNSFKVYIFTTSNSFKDRQRAQQMGVEDYFLKQDLTFDNNLLVSMIHNFINFSSVSG
jgi:CheY-like chemotaxis protein